ncbi:MAG TPA: hypothetical protein VHO70_02470 [Chitinispirillaceae bacterium]|nr:hypothetical protein [Chitinispirillaceae bacterium]
MIPPLIMKIRVVNDRNRPFSLWLPLVLIWPFLGILFVVIVPLAYIVECFAGSSGIRPFSVLLALAEIVCSLRGLDIDVQSKKVNKSNVKIQLI